MQLLAILQALEQLINLATLDLYTLARHTGTSPTTHIAATRSGVSQATSLIVAVMSTWRRIVGVVVELTHDTLDISRERRMVQEKPVLLQVAPDDRDVAFGRIDEKLKRQYGKLAGLVSRDNDTIQEYSH